MGELFLLFRIIYCCAIFIAAWVFTTPANAFDVNRQCNRLAIYADIAVEASQNLLPPKVDTKTKSFIPVGTIAATVMGIRERVELTDTELRFFSFMQAHIISLAVSINGNNPKLSDFADACELGVELGAYNVTDQHIKDNFFSD